MKCNLLTIYFLYALLSASAVSGEEQGNMSGMTNAHNTVRVNVDVPLLVWSDTLAAFAQQWADYLATEKKCRLAHRPDTGKFGQLYGENLYWASALRWSNGSREIRKITAQDVVSSWAEEARNYTYSNNTCSAGETCGHYTQVVWRKTKEVGCASTICSDSSQIWVCNYNPPGNFLGERPY